jgi:phenylalanyl-tRNA synthetase, alpha subunit (EC 6.1.1.20)
LEAAYNARAEVVRQDQLARELEAGALDVTLPGRPLGPGHLHITTRTLRQIYAIFAEMGFQVYEARDVETDEMNFGLLNMPPHHPAREMWDTFWITDDVLLRTHTSPGQIRVMRERYPGSPSGSSSPASATGTNRSPPRSEHQFFQVEGLAVGRHITMTDLIGTLTAFCPPLLRRRATHPHPRLLLTLHRTQH